jgi:hypothetical protein
MNIDVAGLDSVTSANCISCFDCVECCPVTESAPDGQMQTKALSWTLGGKIRINHPKPLFLTVLVLCVIVTAWAVFFVDIDTFRYARSLPRPDNPEHMSFDVKGVSCSGSARLFVYFLNREDFSQVNGYLKVGMRPRSGWVRVNVWYDPARTDQTAIREAVTEPYYDLQEHRWRPSPFEIKGMDY